MIGVDKTGDMRGRGSRGEPIASISRSTGVSEPTVRKHLRMEDLSPSRPGRRIAESELLEPYEATIDAWLLDDCRNWRRQRHTATRAFVRLRDEKGYGGSYSTVQRYVRRRREGMAEEGDARDAQGYLRLSWLPGECQVDFGEADLGVRGVVTRGRYLTVSLPHPGVGPAQVFWGETSECVRQGLRNALEFVGGVPARAASDNAAGVGGRVCGEVGPSEMLRRLSAHYCLGHTLTNPYSGNEKGNVEAKVGYHRRSLFVPVPQMHDAEAFNERLLRDSPDMSAEKRHHGLGVPELGLFEEGRAALAELPPAGYQCVRWETRRRSRQGVLALGGTHRCSAGPACAGKEVAVAVGAFRVRVVDEGTGEVVAEHEREWGSVPTDSSDPALRPRPLCMRPTGWRDSVVRQSLPREPVEFLDGEGGADLGRDLRVLRDASAQHGWEAAVRGMGAALRATGGVGGASVELSAAVAASGGTRAEYGEEPDPGEYDRAVGLAGGGGGHAAPGA